MLLCELLFHEVHGGLAHLRAVDAVADAAPYRKVGACSKIPSDTNGGPPRIGIARVFWGARRRSRPDGHGEGRGDDEREARRGAATEPLGEHGAREAD